MHFVLFIYKYIFHGLTKASEKAQAINSHFKEPTCLCVVVKRATHYLPSGNLQLAARVMIQVSHFKEIVYFLSIFYLKYFVDICFQFDM